jgi:hypothetical protein
LGSFFIFSSLSIVVLACRYKREWLDNARRAEHGNVGLQKTRSHVVAASTVIKDFVDTTADSMPHRSRTMSDGIRETQKVLPSTYTQESICEEINGTLKLMNIQPISLPAFNKLWNTEFKNVTIARHSSFSKCDKCIALKAKIRAAKNMAELGVYRQEMHTHNIEQRSCRSVYYANRRLSSLNPRKYLCIIIDKMDQHKTCIPRLQQTPKSCHGEMQLPIALSGILTHGQGDGTYGNFTLPLWPSDPNFTIGSLAKCLRMLENHHKGYSGDLVGNKDYKQPLHSAVMDLLPLKVHEEMDKASHNSTSGPVQVGTSSEPAIILEPVTLASSSSSCSGPPPPAFTPLAKNLLLQMDNCGSEKKNQYMLAYLSLLVAKGVFETITVGFLMVGHTHEDIDALFSKLAELSRKSTSFTLPHMMKLFERCISTKATASLVTEVPDFKGFLEGYCVDFCGHSKPLQFFFTMRDGIPIMQYKMRPTDPEWLPIEGIEIFKRGQDGRPNLPQGDPKPVPIKAMKDCSRIIQGIKRYMEVWKSGMPKDPTMVTGYSKRCTPVLNYWERIIAILQEGDGNSTTKVFDKLHEEFWPQSRHAGRDAEPRLEVFQEEMPVDEEPTAHYVGPRANKPRPHFVPSKDLDVDMVVLVRNDEEFEAHEQCPVWLGLTTSTPTNKEVYVQWYEPVGKYKTIVKLEIRWSPVTESRRRSDADDECC